MPRDDNVEMLNLLGLGEGYRFKTKYLAEDSLEIFIRMAIPKPSSRHISGYQPPIRQTKQYALN